MENREARPQRAKTRLTAQPAGSAGASAPHTPLPDFALPEKAATAPTKTAIVLAFAAAFLAGARAVRSWRPAAAVGASVPRDHMPRALQAPTPSGEVADSLPAGSLAFEYRHRWPGLKRAMVSIDGGPYRLLKARDTLVIPIPSEDPHELALFADLGTSRSWMTLHYRPGAAGGCVEGCPGTACVPVRKVADR